MTSQTGLGPQVAPHAAVGLLVIAAAATRATAEATGDTGAVTATVAVVAFVLAVAIGTKRGQRLTCRKSRTRLYAFLAVAASWLTAMTATGLSLGAVEILAAMVYALSLHWWRLKRIPNPQPDAAAVDETAGYKALWEEYVSGKGCVLEGSRLVRPTTIAAGVRFDLMLLPGKQDLGTVTEAARKIRGALGLVRGQDLLIEEHPDLPEPHCQITIITRSPVRKTVEWPGPKAFDPRTGRVSLGPFVDGLGHAQWKAYTEDRLWGGYLQGGTGSGKSRMIESIAMSLAASITHPTVIFFGDGQGGASSPLLAKHADHVARTAEQMRVMLSGLLLVMQLRQDENDLDGLTGFAPHADRPGILAIIDECHKFLIFDDIQKMVATIAREGGKVGIALLLASQQPTLDAFGGAGTGNNAETIRSNLLSGNGIILRSKSKNTKTVFEVDVNPSKFPAIPGYAMVVERGDDVRAVPFRGFHVTNALAEVWPAKILWRELDPGSANTFGRTYLRRREDAIAAREAKRARVEALRAGRPVPTEEPITRTIPAPAPMQTVGFKVLQFPVWQAPAQHTPTTPTPTPTSTAGPTLKDIHTKVVNAITSGAVLRDGYCKPSWVARHLGIGEKWAGIALNELVAHGFLSKDGKQGQYFPTGKKLTNTAA